MNRQATYRIKDYPFEIRSPLSKNVTFSAFYFVISGRLAFTILELF